MWGERNTRSLGSPWTNTKLRTISLTLLSWMPCVKMDRLWTATIFLSLLQIGHIFCILFDWSLLYPWISSDLFLVYLFVADIWSNQEMGTIHHPWGLIQWLVAKEVWFMLWIYSFLIDVFVYTPACLEILKEYVFNREIKSCNFPLSIVFLLIVNGLCIVLFKHLAVGLRCYIILHFGFRNLFRMDGTFIDIDRFASRWSAVYLNSFSHMTKDRVTHLLTYNR